ncbi:hypothetical protein [Spirosoma areae]
MKPNEKKALQEYYDATKRILSQAPGPDVHEPAPIRLARIDRLKADFEGFCWHYFPQHMKGKLGYFHLKAAKQIIADPLINIVLEWPRAHAKSVFADIMVPMFLLANGELNGMIIAGQNQVKSITLLIDIQLQLETNTRFVADFGEQKTFGDWGEGSFTTRDGVGFWAFGRGQSPRGTRKGERRPDYIVVDDIDDADVVKNPDRVQEAVDWVNGDLRGCFDMTRGRFVVVGNRIHRHSILAHLVGDLEDGDPINPTVTHSKVFALENPKTHKEDQSEKGVPAWKEKFDRQKLKVEMDKFGYRLAQREFFHRHITEGRIFKTDWILYETLPKLSAYQCIVVYNDPSYKDTKRNDFKAIVAVGKIGRYYDLLKCWVAQATTEAMVRAHYDIQQWLTDGGYDNAYHFMEANFMQDMHLKTYQDESEKRGWMLSIRSDDRKKPDKYGRIEQLTPLFEQGLVRINANLKQDPHYRNFLDQLLGFPNAHDDAPDSFEGAVWKLNRLIAVSVPITVGGQRRQNRW